MILRARLSVSLEISLNKTEENRFKTKLICLKHADLFVRPKIEPRKQKILPFVLKNEPADFF